MRNKFVINIFAFVCSRIPSAPLKSAFDSAAAMRLKKVWLVVVTNRVGATHLFISKA